MNKHRSIKHNQSLKAFNTFGVDVSAQSFITVTSTEELVALIKEVKQQETPVLPLGGGSNILFTKDFEGLVIKNEIAYINKVQEDEQHILLEVGGGYNWHEFVLHAVNNGWQGIENLSLIPGTVGASPIQNIGAYGVEIKDVFESLQAVALEDGSLHTFTKANCDFGYRNSVFKNALKGKFIISSVTFRLNKPSTYRFNTSYGAIEQTLKEKGIEKVTVKDISDAVIAIRESKLPDPKEVGNCGSFFKNPEIPQAQYDTLKAEYPAIPGYPTTEGMIKVPAGWLIEQCGWKGKQVGNVGTYPKQALVLINCGGASGEEAYALALEIKASVMEKFGVSITPEVNIL
ncbi:UDP-N-acetylmuramate dehydrogenase [Algivirga pacifica]|uniref:UDP-N-acetylenolpyruvoylglucosamine reductase n=1 Tax=Algivirga pacifica TaxID=1162670 RepID=A0ABP9DCJ6_9BACT